MVKQTKQSAKTARGEKTRTTIKKAALDLFCDRGFAGTSVDMICKKAGCVKTAIYWHFGNKDGLMAALIEDTEREWVESIEMHVNAAPPAEQLDLLLARLRDIIENRSHMLKLVEVVTIEAALMSDEAVIAVRRLNERALTAISEGFSHAFGQQIPDGYYLGHTITSLFHGIHRQRSVYGEEADLDQYFRDMKYTIIASVAERFQRKTK